MRSKTVLLKIKALVFFIVIGCCSSNAQNTVIIPDSGFIAWLQINGFGSCLSDSALDTTCPLVLNTTYINISYAEVNNLEGIQYFKGLDSLRCNADTILTNIPALPPALRIFECRNNALDSLPPLPDSLVRLICEFNRLSSLPTLPASLRYLTCYNNNLTTLPTLPDSLQLLYCSGNHLDSLPALPDSLLLLSCFSNQLSTLPVLPNLLEELLCGDNLLQTLPVLPASLTDLDCYSNQLTSLPALPDSLNFLGCYSNKLTALPALPQSLTSLNCEYNNLSGLPDLPDSMYQLFCDNNPNMQCLPVLNTVWDLEFFNNPDIDCVPDYGNVYSSEPALNSLPLCDSTNNSNNCTIVNDINQPQEIFFSIYPNPAKNYADVVFTNTEGKVVLQLFDITGKEINSLSIQSDNYRLQTGNLAAGTYLVKISDGQGASSTGKLVIAE